MATTHNIIAILAVLLCIGCNAPRNNPLDPVNENYEYATIRGRVQTYRVPHEPISDVFIYWTGASRVTHSDGSGDFTITDIKPADGWLIFDSPAYFIDSSHVLWTNSTVVFVQQYLNTLPLLDSLVFYSSILNLYNDLQFIRLSLIAMIEDPDNDIDSVYVICPGLGVYACLDYDLDTRFFRRDLSMQDLGINSPESVIGHSFNIYVKDRLDHRLLLSSSVIKRIIKEQVELDSPGGYEIVGPNPTLKWKPVNTGFPLEYLVEIYTNEMNLVWLKGHLAATASSITVDIDLPPDQYRWAVWIIDEFQNRSRSKYKSFEVQ